MDHQNSSPSSQRSDQFTAFPRNFRHTLGKEKTFLAILSACFLLAGATYQTPHIAMWVGFIFAGYAVIANDSIQTIGTFIASNKHRPWWVLWLFIGIAVVVLVFLARPRME